MMLVSMIMSHFDISKLYVNIIVLHVDIYFILHAGTEICHHRTEFMNLNLVC